MCLLHRMFRRNLQGRVQVANSFNDGYPASRKTWTAIDSIAGFINHSAE